MLYNEEFEKFKPIDYYSIANELFNKKEILECNSNALFRCIVSRAYYAAFLHIRQFLKNEEYSFDGFNEHERVINILKKDKPIGMSFKNNDIKDKLWALKKNRIVCDYKFKCPDKNNDWSNKDLDVLLNDSKWIIDNVSVEKFSDGE